MTVPRHLDEAAARLKEASRRIDAARAKPTDLGGLREWLSALTDYAMALAEIHEFTNESVHEKLHQLAGKLGQRRFPDEPAAEGAVPEEP